MNKIHKISYIENGYFEVKYNIGTVVQDLGGIKLSCSLDKSIKDIIMFLRKLKIEKLQDSDEYDELKYCDHIVYDITEELKSHQLHQLSKMASMNKM